LIVVEVIQVSIMNSRIVLKKTVIIFSYQNSLYCTLDKRENQNLKEKKRIRVLIQEIKKGK
jgi:hypothetical protein